MSLSSLSTTSDLRSSLLSTDLRTTAVSARRTRQQDSEASALAALMATGQQQTQPASFRDALEEKLTAAVDAGTLSQDDADIIRQAMDQLDQQLQGERTPGKGPGPDPSEMFSTLDANGDGTLTEEEFVAGRPDDVSEEQAQAFYAELAGENSTGVTLDQFADALASVRPQDGGGIGRPDPSQLFSDLDTDGDGLLTREEFVAGRPEGVSEDEAAALYQKLVGDSADGVTEQQFSAAMTQTGGAGGPPPAGGGGGGGGGDSSDEKTEISRTTTTSGSQTVTVITYSDGSTETTTEPTSTSGTSATASSAATSASDSVASRLMALVQTLGGDTSAMSFLKTSMTGRMYDVRA